MYEPNGYQNKTCENKLCLPSLSICESIKNLNITNKCMGYANLGRTFLKGMGSDYRRSPLVTRLGQFDVIILY